MKQKITPWLGFIFCAFLSAIAWLGLLTPGSSWWQPAFFCFLPMCFFYIGSELANTRKEIRELQAKLAELEQPKSN